MNMTIFADGRQGALSACSMPVVQIIPAAETICHRNSILSASLNSPPLLPEDQVRAPLAHTRRRSNPASAKGFLFKPTDPGLYRC